MCVFVCVVKGDVRHGVQRAKQANREPGGIKGDPTGARGGSSLHCYQRR